MDRPLSQVHNPQLSHEDVEARFRGIALADPALVAIRPKADRPGTSISGGVEGAYSPAGVRTISDFPLIAAGCSWPSSARIVGATSARMPPSRTAGISAVTTIGTGFIEWAVFGLPSGSSIW